MNFAALSRTLKRHSLWTTLKRYIDMSDKARLSTAVAGELMGTVRPSAIPLSTKVILIGNDATYDELAEKDGQFLKLFKISPEFDYQMPASRENILATVGYLRRVAKDLLPLSDNACKELLRYSSWFAENRNSTPETYLWTGFLKAGPGHAIQLKSGDHKGRILVGCDHKYQIYDGKSIVENSEDEDYYGSREDLIERAYVPCKRCNP